MKKFFPLALMIILFAQICNAAPASIDRANAYSKARQSFVLTSVEGDKYDVFIVGEDEKVLDDWFWAQGDKIFSGNYFAYIGKENSSTLNIQDAQLFAQNYGGEYPQRINVTQLDRDGFYRVKGKFGLPDMLVSKIQITGGGVFDTKIFVIKDGRLQLVKFSENKKLQDSRDTIFAPIIYRDDGTISVPWHTNVAPEAGTYITAYMFDLDNLILSPAYTKKI